MDKYAIVELDTILVEYAPEVGDYRLGGYAVQLDHSTQYATIYFGDKPVATLQRAMVMERGFTWKLFDTKGNILRKFSLSMPYARLAAISVRKLRLLDIN